MLIAIDGPSGAGKGTIARYLAKEFNLRYLDTGLLYRAVGWIAMTQGVEFGNIPALIKIAETIDFDKLNEWPLRGEEVASAASQVAALPEVRKALLSIQQTFAKIWPVNFQGVVLDGRDIGTIICPHASCKIFITANSEVRANRRLHESPNSGLNTQQMQEVLAHRDQRDQTRTSAPLVPAKDAYILDTSDFSIEEACKIAYSYVMENCFSSTLLKSNYS